MLSFVGEVAADCSVEDGGASEVVDRCSRTSQRSQRMALVTSSYPTGQVLVTIACFVIGYIFFEAKSPEWRKQMLPDLFVVLGLFDEEQARKSASARLQ